MKKLYILFVTTIITILSGCERDELFNLSLDGAFLTIKLNSIDNAIATRITSGDEEEKMITNAHVFIFNANGDKIFSKTYEDLSTNKSIEINEDKIVGGKNMTIAVIANIGEDNGVMNVPIGGNISNKAELIATQVSLSDNYIERGTSFLMSGMLENVSLSSSVNTTNITLKRIDSKVRFNIIPGINEDGYLVKFIPTEWRIVSSPKKVLLMENESLKDEIEANDENYFSSDWNNYDPLTSLPVGSPDDIVATFSFYALENNITAKKNIPTEGLNDIESYALRDKQIKNEDGTNKAEFEYANDRGTYIEFTGTLSYALHNSDKITADVKYMVHLGGDISDVNNYSNIRNTNYTYNIRILSVNQIIVEVLEDKETRPGVEGDVVEAETIIDNLDAYNNILNIDFKATDLDGGLTWSVNTPFSDGIATETVKPKDMNWVLFRIGKSESTGEYNNIYNTYCGDNNVYSDKLTSSNIKVFFDKYISEINTNTDKMLNIDQLVEVLKECKRRIDNKEESNLFDKKGNIRFTCFVNEFYYEQNPENQSKNFDPNLWKKFVNVNKRVLNIINKQKVSADGNSSYLSAIYSLRQASIQSIFNTKNNTEVFSGWGTQFYPNEPIKKDNTNNYREFTKDNTETNDNADGEYNGRRNFVSFIKQKRWEEYIDKSTWLLNEYYDAAKYRCLLQNRDINGNGEIEDNEIQWYLASINQLTNLWIGEESINPTSKLYQHKTWEIGKQHIVSSTVLDYNNPQILWASEGSATGSLKSREAKVREELHYRCLRNLGLEHNTSVNTPADRIYDFESPYSIGSVKNNGFITLSRLNTKSIRGTYTRKELPDHELRDDRGYNKPFKKFEIAYDAEITVHFLDFLNITYRGETWEEVRKRSQPDGKNPLCPVGWRIPNQRELALMHALLKDIKDGNKNFTAWPLTVKPNWSPAKRADHFCRTGFNKKWTTERPGFAVNDNFYMLSHDGGNGGARCVRDVR